MAVPIPAPVAASGEMEKTIVLEFAQTLREKLEKSGKYRVVMTRTDDTLHAARRARAHARAQQGAALFVSIHADALAARREADVRGATVYTVSDTASDDEAARLAEDENKADVIAGVDLSSEPEEVADILIDLTQRETKNFSAHFARAVVGELKTAAKLHKHPLKSAGFKVLKAPDVPSVLIELGYVSNKQDLKLMTSEAWRARTTRRAGAGGEYLFLDPARRFRSGAGHELRCGDEARQDPEADRAKPKFDHKTGGVSRLPDLLTDWFGAHKADAVSSGRSGRFAGGQTAAAKGRLNETAAAILRLDLRGRHRAVPRRHRGRRRGCSGISPRTCRIILNCRTTSRR